MGENNSLALNKMWRLYIIGSRTASDVNWQQERITVIRQQDLTVINWKSQMFWIYNRKKILSVHLKLLSIHRYSSVALCRYVFCTVSGVTLVLFGFCFILYFIFILFFRRGLREKISCKILNNFFSLLLIINQNIYLLSTLPKQTTAKNPKFFLMPYTSTFKLNCIQTMFHIFKCLLIVKSSLNSSLHSC